ncbi:MAG: methyltransferase domain-containing protein [Alphaproteobacteria bacterium]
MHSGATMHTVPRIFDESLRRIRKQRTASRAHEADFLHRAAADEIADRLNAINRNFPAFVCHGAPDLSQHVATHAIASDITATAASTQIAFEESAIPFAPGTLDAFASILTLHALNDLPGALLQIRRALKPDGFFIAALFGSRTLVELRSAFMQAEGELRGGISPRVAPLPDVREAGALLQRAGFALPVADTEDFTVSYADPFRLLSDLRLMGETNILHDRDRRTLRRNVLMRALEICRNDHAGTDGRMKASFEIIYLSGWSPHESQQKPLAPGSATMSLEKALGEVGAKRGS